VTIDEVNQAMNDDTTVYLEGVPVLVDDVQPNRVAARQGRTVWDCWVSGNGIDTVVQPERLSATP